MRFIRRIAVFAALDDQGRRWLARRVRERHVRAGHVLVREGASDTSCFLLRSGAAEVRSRSNGGRAVAMLGPGAIFGEGAVLTGGPRMATVIATAESELLEIAGEDLRHAVERNPAVARELVYLFRLRRRPRRDPAVEVHEGTDAEGRSITTLKHPGRMAYYRLSERGRFVWDRLDGDRTLRQLSPSGQDGDLLADARVSGRSLPATSKRRIWTRARLVPVSRPWRYSLLRRTIRVPPP